MPETFVQMCHVCRVVFPQRKSFVHVLPLGNSPAVPPPSSLWSIFCLLLSGSSVGVELLNVDVDLCNHECFDPALLSDILLPDIAWPSWKSHGAHTCCVLPIKMCTWTPSSLWTPWAIMRCCFLSANRRVMCFASSESSKSRSTLSNKLITFIGLAFTGLAGFWIRAQRKLNTPNTKVGLKRIYICRSGCCFEQCLFYFQVLFTSNRWTLDEFSNGEKCTVSSEQKQTRHIPLS